MRKRPEPSSVASSRMTVPPKVPTATEGDVYARYLVRMVELRQSVRIARQALDGLPAGPVRADAPGIVLPERDKMKTEMEALIYHFKLVVDGFAPPAGADKVALPFPGRATCRPTPLP